MRKFRVIEGGVPEVKNTGNSLVFEFNPGKQIEVFREVVVNNNGNEAVLTYYMMSVVEIPQEILELMGKSAPLRRQDYHVAKIKRRWWHKLIQMPLHDIIALRLEKEDAKMTRRALQAIKEVAISREINEKLGLKTMN